MEKRRGINLGRPSWGTLFMSIAFEVAARASCNYIRAGVVIVKDNRIIATGYNGAAPGVPNCLEAGCRKQQQGIANELKGTGECRGTHAEMNALQYAGREAHDSTLYTVLFPCNHCAKQAASVGVDRVIYAIKYKDSDPTAAMETLSQAGIQVHYFNDLHKEGFNGEYEKQHKRILEVIAQG